MPNPNTDTIDGKSSGELKQMLMETSVPESGEEIETEEEEVTESEETEPETKPDETGEPETKKEVKPKEESEELRYKIKVEGKEEELPLPKILEFAQKGRYLEREMKKLKDEREKLRSNPQKGEEIQSPFGFDETKANEWFVEQAQKNPFLTIANTVRFITDQDRKKDRDEKTKDTAFELEKSEEHGELWKFIEPRYKKFRDLGHSRDISEAMAKADFYQDFALSAMQTGMKKGAKKQKLKEMAEIPTGEKRTATTGIPSPKELEKMSSGDIAKHLKRFKNPGW